MIGIYTLFFAMFGIYYVTDYHEELLSYNMQGTREAIEYAQSLNPENIYVSDLISYSKVLLFANISPYEYMETASYDNYPSEWLIVNRIGNFVMKFDVEYPSCVS